MAQQKKKTFIVVVVVVAVLLLVGFLAKQSSVTDRGGDGAHSGHEPAAQATPAEKNATASEAPLAGKRTKRPMRQIIPQRLRRHPRRWRRRKFARR